MGRDPGREGLRRREEELSDKQNTLFREAKARLTKAVRVHLRAQVERIAGAVSGRVKQTRVPLSRSLHGRSSELCVRRPFLFCARGDSEVLTIWMRWTGRARTGVSSASAGRRKRCQTKISAKKKEPD